MANPEVRSRPFNSRGNRRAVSLCLIGFECDPERITFNCLADLNIEVHKKGDLRGVNQSFDKNFVAFWTPAYALQAWDIYLEKIACELGGWDRLEKLITEINPEDSWFRIDVPIFGSPYVESSVIDRATIRHMATIGLALEVGVREFDVNEPTHHPVP